MMARFQQVKAGKSAFESDGEVEDINNVEKALHTQNIEIRDSAGSFRELDDVIPEVAKKYKELMAAGKDVAAKDIVGAIAGVRQINMIETLFQNWDIVKESQTEVADNLGLTASRYNIYLESIEAKQNKFLASVESYWQRLINSGFIKFMYDVGSFMFTPTYTIRIESLNLEESQERLEKTSEALEKLKKSGKTDMGTASIMNQLSSDTGRLERHIDSLMDKIDSQSAGFEKWTGDLENVKTIVEDLGDSFEEPIKKLSELQENADNASKTVTSGFDAITNALNQYTEAGFYSLSTAQSLIEAGYAEAVSINTVTGQVNINIPLLQQLAIAQIDAAIKALDNAKSQAILEGATSATTAKITQQINALNAQKKALSGEFVDTKSLLGVLNSFTGAKISSAGASSGATEASKQAKKAYEEEKKSIDKQVDSLKDQKKALQDNLKSYKDKIDAQKQKLQLDKEEQGYQKGLEEKNKDIAKIDRELYEIQFDNSEEANAKRLQLEEERAKATTDIAEYQADRTYDIEVQALDDEYDAFERVMNLQIAGIDALIDKYGEMIDKISEAISALSELSSAGGGGGYSAPIAPTVTDKKSNYKEVYEDYGIQYKNIVTGKYVTKGYYNSLPSYHTGGVVESNKGSITGTGSNDIFAKLLSGEVVSTKEGIDNFFSSILPKIASPVTSMGGGGSVTIGDINLNVAGNLDKTVVPQIKPLILDAVNEALKNRGLRRNATSMAI
jgi:hypothetical protein